MEKLLEHVKTLAKKSTEAKTPPEAMNFAQAALNIAHAYATWRGAQQLKH